MMIENYLQNNQNLNLEAYYPLLECQRLLATQSFYNPPPEGESKSLNEFKRFGEGSNNNLTSGLIDAGNLTINTKTLTFSNIYDSDEARSFGIGVGGNLRSGSGGQGGSGGGGVKGSGSISLNYSMHDFKQTTNATIGSGDINLGTTLNLDENNNLISVSSNNPSPNQASPSSTLPQGESNIGDALQANAGPQGESNIGDALQANAGPQSESNSLIGLNRNINNSQIITKSLQVKPITIKETFEFGRNSSDTTKNNPDATISEVFSNMAKDYISQINPLRGVANIVDGISTDIGNMTTEITGDQNKGQEIKNQIDEKANDVAAKIWASPNSALGLTIGLTGYVVGKATGKEVKLDIGENAIQFIGVPFAGGAITLGNVENYFSDANPNKIWLTYEANDRVTNINDVVLNDLILLGKHEVKHTYQAEKFGPFFLPVYLYQGIIGAARNGVFTLNPVNQYNPMEQEADNNGKSH